MEKTYYWMKLKADFMTSELVDYLMSKPDGANYVVLYQMLCLKTLNTDGRLESHIGEVIIPYSVDKIVRECKWFSADTVMVALNAFKQLGLVYEEVDGTLVIARHSELVGKESDAAERMRKMRQKKAIEAKDTPLLDCERNSVTQDVTEKCNSERNSVTTEYRDKSIDNKSIDINNNICVSDKPKTRKRIDYSEDFEEFWKAYPRQINKGDAYASYKARLKDGFSPEELISAAVGYARDCKRKGTETEYIKHPKTFLSSKLNFTEYIGQEEKPKKSKVSVGIVAPDGSTWDDYDLYEMYMASQYHMSPEEIKKTVEGRV